MGKKFVYIHSIVETLVEIVFLDFSEKSQVTQACICDRHNHFSLRLGER